MTPQERKMIEELFERLEKLEDAARDEDAVNAINQGLDRAPNALYPLVQSVLVQDEALKRADARIRELEEELGIEPAQPPQQKSFLDGMRDTLTGRREGSVPSVRQDEPARQSKWNTDEPPRQSKWNTGAVLGSGSGQGGYQQGGYQQGGNPQAGYPPQQAQASPGGGSFLGTAAATAAGVVGGALLMNSFRGMFGGGQQGQSAGQGNRAFDQGGGGGSPSSGGSGGGELGRQAGLDDIGRGGATPASDGSGGLQRQGAFGDGSGSQQAGPFDVAQNDVNVEGDSDFNDDGDFDSDIDSGGDTDTA